MRVHILKTIEAYLQAQAQEVPAAAPAAPQAPAEPGPQAPLGESPPLLPPPLLQPQLKQLEQLVHDGASA
jgi:hypothetical protein